MALALADRVKETSTTTGTGAYSLDGAATGFQTFVAGIGDGNTCYYSATDGIDWEVGIGTVTDAAPDTLARTTIIASSNAGAAVNWGAGTKTIFCSLPASKTLAPQVDTLELGHASDTTLERVSAGVISVEGQTVGMLSQVQEWTAAQTFSAQMNLPGSSVLGTSGFLGLGTTSPARMFHVQGGNALWRLDRDVNSTALTLHRFPTGDFTTPWKGFLLGVNASSSGVGDFSLSDYGTATGGAPTVRFNIDNSGHILPGADNAQNFGAADKRLATIFAATGTINTSDNRDKIVEARSVAAAARIVDAVEPVLFKWKEGGREIVQIGTKDVVTGKDKNGRDIIEKEAIWEDRVKPGRRVHAGWIAQEIKAAFDAEGFDCGAWGLDDPSDPDSRQWVRPDQLTALLWEALRETRRESEVLKARVAALEGKSK